MGREWKVRTVNFTPEQDRQLVALSDKTGERVATVIRRFISEGLERENTEPNGS